MCFWLPWQLYTYLSLDAMVLVEFGNKEFHIVMSGKFCTLVMFTQFLNFLYESDI